MVAKGIALIHYRLWTLWVRNLTRPACRRYHPGFPRHSSPCSWPPRSSDSLVFPYLLVRRLWFRQSELFLDFSRKFFSYDVYSSSFLSFLKSLRPDSFNGRYRDSRAEDWFDRFERYCNAIQVPETGQDRILYAGLLLIDSRLPMVRTTRHHHRSHYQWPTDLRPIKFSSSNSVNASLMRITLKTPLTRFETYNKNDPSTNTLPCSRNTIAASMTLTTRTPFDSSAEVSSRAPTARRQPSGYRRRRYQRLDCARWTSG